MLTSDANPGWGLRRPTIIESVAVLAIVAVLIALIVPGVQWASSGSIRFPVRVLVFDATRGTPLTNAKVAIFQAPPMLSPTSLEEFHDRYDPSKFVRDSYSLTGADGTAVIEWEFSTGANHERPVTHAHLRRAWVHVQADGYGGVVIPVRHESMPTATLREQKELLVSVGLTPEQR